MLGKILFCVYFFLPSVTAMGTKPKIFEECNEQTISYSVLHASGNHETVTKDTANDTFFRRIIFAFRPTKAEHAVPQEFTWEDDEESRRRFQQLHENAKRASHKQAIIIEYRKIIRQENEKKVTFLGIRQSGNCYEISYNKKSETFSGSYIYTFLCMKLPFVKPVSETDAKVFFTDLETQYESHHVEVENLQD